MPRHLLLLLLLALAAAACGDSERASDPEIPVSVGTALDSRNTPVVILEEKGGPRALPIWIGTAEFLSIASQLNQEPPPRPNFHDLAQRVIQQLDAQVDRVVVTELRGGTYFAILKLRTNGREIEIDVRPSDGIAVALRTKSPILVRASVFEDARIEMSEPETERAI